ncbi:MAG: hypothetical protein KIT20_00285 [Alphaproteobacteria bacterium]|nr:hypothetical protein [Alphaproteobacteria bacterium]
MSLTSTVAEGLRGAILLFRQDAAGLGHFDLSIEGFWRSFLVPILLSPLSVLAGLLALGSEPDVPDGYLAIKMAGDLVSIAAFPILMVPLARILGLGAAYVPYIVAGNWAALPVTIANLVLALLMLSAGASFGEAGLSVVSLFIGLPLLVLVLRYLFTIARIALGAGPGTAAGLTAVQFLLWVLIDQATEGFF